MKILVVRYAAIGDCIMTAWAASAIRSAHPEAQIYWAIQPRCSEIVDEQRLAKTRVIPREKRKGQGAAVAILRYWAGLRREKFDLGVDFQGHSKTSLALRMAAPRKRASLKATDAFAKALNPPTTPPKGLTHIVEKECWLAEELTGGKMPRLPLMPVREELHRPWRDLSPYVTIQLGAGSDDKRAPLTLWQKTAGILSREGIPVITLGAPADGALEGCQNFAGKATLSESLAAVAESRVHLASDTGTGHAAAAYGTPVVSVFGPTNPAKCRPWTDRGSVIRKGKNFEDVTPDEVVAEALKWWREGR